jgi:uncharacterized damage-inducible protein DinB
MSNESPTSFDLDEAMDLLARTPGTMSALLRDLPDAWVRADEGPGTWSPLDVLGHFVHGERADWIPRAEIILQQGASVPFEPFDRRGHETWWEGWSLERLLEEFARLRACNLDRLDAMELDDAKLDLPGVHPELGAVTMRELIAAWVVHDLHHVGQVTRAMAKRYRDEVGAWGSYLSVLTR